MDTAVNLRCWADSETGVKELKKISDTDCAGYFFERRQKDVGAADCAEAFWPVRSEK